VGKTRADPLIMDSREQHNPLLAATGSSTPRCIYLCMATYPITRPRYLVLNTGHVTAVELSPGQQPRGELTKNDSHEQSGQQLHPCAGGCPAQGAPIVIEPSRYLNSTVCGQLSHL
jgi:hypothetical protein